MFLDPSRFSIVQALAPHTATLCAEVAELRHEDFVPWPMSDAFDGDWRLFPLLKYGPHYEHVVADYEKNRRACPRTWDLLSRLPCVQLASFSWLGANSHIHAHTDAYQHGLVRVHVGLRVSPQSLMRYGSEVQSLTPEGILVLDGQTPHESANLSADHRITLLLDVAMTEAEHDYVLQVSPFRRRAAENWLQSRGGSATA
jgi:ornithine lipid ester-linked acyl 2-hydroxylase